MAKEAIVLIKKERERQIKELGYNYPHDKKHCNGELAIAAACYAVHGVINTMSPVNGEESCNYFEVVKLFKGSEAGLVEDAWPFDLGSDKRKKHDRVKLLVQAAAMLVAEIDRLNTEK